MNVFINERPRQLNRVYQFLNIVFINVCPNIVGADIKSIFQENL